MRAAIRRKFRHVINMGEVSVDETRRPMSELVSDPARFLLIAIIVPCDTRRRPAKRVRAATESIRGIRGLGDTGDITDLDLHEHLVVRNGRHRDLLESQRHLASEVAAVGNGSPARRRGPNRLSTGRDVPSARSTGNHFRGMLTLVARITAARIVAGTGIFGCGRG